MTNEIELTPKELLEYGMNAAARSFKVALKVWATDRVRKSETESELDLLQEFVDSINSIERLAMDILDEAMARIKEELE